MPAPFRRYCRRYRPPVVTAAGRPECSLPGRAGLAFGGGTRRRRGLEGERAGVDAVSLCRRSWPVAEDLAPVTAAATAPHVSAAHEHAVIRAQLYRLRYGWLVKARPAGARVEFRVRAEQLTSAARAAIGAVLRHVDVLAGKGTLGAAAAQHVELLAGQLLPPLLGWLLDLRCCPGSG